MEHFNRIRNRKKWNAFVRSGILGGSVAVTAASVPVIVYTLLEQDVPWLWIILGSVALGALTFGVLLLCLYPFKRKLSKQLDRILGGEKVQTMVEFSDSKTAMTQIQRMDTEEKLKQLPSTVVRFKRAWHCIVALCMAAVTLAGAIVCALLPDDIIGAGGAGSGDSSSEEEVEIFEMTDFQETALIQLIEYVQASDMQKSLKDLTVEQLEGLLVVLKEELPRTEMVDAVGSVIVTVDTAVEDVNTGFELATAMGLSGQPLVERLGNAVGAVELERFTVLYLECAEAFKPFTKDEVSEEPSDEPTAREGEAPEPEESAEVGGLAKNNVAQFSVALSKALIDSKVDMADPLFLAVEALRAAMAGQLDNIQYYSAESWASKVDALFSDNVEAFTSALTPQITNDEVRDHVIRKLKEIFALTDDEMPEISNDYVPTYVEEEGANDDILHSGGLGTGDYNFPSDELVYNPMTGEQIRYGELLATYHNIYLEALREGTISPELERFLQTYFDILTREPKSNN